MTVFEELESNVRYYCRQWPVVFARATGATLIDETDTSYIDLFSGAGALSYGHNNPLLVEVAVEHLRAGRVTHSLDTHTPEKRAFLEALRDRILVPRALDMVVQFVGPTGATAVEAALQLAERLTGRRSVVAYEGGYHGMTAGAASVSASLDRPGDRATDGACTFLPHVAAHDERATAQLESAVRTPVGEQLPGALIIEATQGEGGARPFDPPYLAEVRRVCSDHGLVVIADDVQAGVGRTGPFFSFECSRLDPDIICLSKSLSGLGLPLAVNLVRRELDQWAPGEFTGTFRGNNLAFVTATAVLQHYWHDDELEQATARRGHLVRQALEEFAVEAGAPRCAVHGNGLIWGLEFGDAEIATAVATAAFRHGLIVETCGSGGATIKVMPPLLIRDDELATGLERFGDAVKVAAIHHRPTDLVGGRVS
jgi:diaminobutyrate-2-oxoglutarate transaminase